MKRIAGLIWWLWWPLTLLAQTVAEDQGFNVYDVETRVMQFQEELSTLYSRSMVPLSFDFDDTMSQSLLNSVNEDVSSMEASAKSFDTRWNTYLQATQSFVASDDSLLSKVAEVQTLQQKVNESVTTLRQQFDQMKAFNEAELFIFSQDSLYSKLYHDAMTMSYAAQLQAQLEKVKASEQLQFAEVDKHYNEAKQAAETFDQLGERMARIESKYLELKVVSGKIQAAAYVPLLQRIKDYLMNIAAVSIVLMFANLVVTRVKTIMKVKAQAKKLKDLMGNGGGQDYPTI